MLWSLLAGAAVFLLVGCQSMQRTPIPTLAPLDEAQFEQLIQDTLQDRSDALTSRYPGLQVPHVERVRIVSPMEWAQTIAECVTDKGFSAKATPDGGVAFDGVPNDQGQALDLANYECSVMYPMDPRYSTPLTDQQIDYLYEYYVYDLTPCLENEGFAVAESPSRQSFRDTYGTQDMWSPYTDVGDGLSESAWYHIQELCPQTPEYLFGQ